MVLFASGGHVHRERPRIVLEFYRQAEDSPLGSERTDAGARTVEK